MNNRKYSRKYICKYVNNIFSDLKCKQSKMQSNNYKQSKIQSKIFFRSEDVAESVAEGVEKPDVPFPIPKVSPGDQECELCGKNFPSTYRLKEHQRLHTGEQKFSCELCKHLFATEATLKHHKKICGQDKKHKCSKCDFVAATKEQINRHQKKHRVAKGKNKKCECGAKFTRVESNREHWTYCKKNPKRIGPFFCKVPDCRTAQKRKEFSRPKNLNAHMRNIHGFNPKRSKTDD